MACQLNYLPRQIIKLALLSVGLLAISYVYAADGGINTALAEAGCIQSDIKRLPPIGKNQIYEATCFGKSHTIVRVICRDGRCISDHPHGRLSDPEDRR